jgi:hypothetical protein
MAGVQELQEFRSCRMSPCLPELSIKMDSRAFYFHDEFRGSIRRFYQNQRTPPAPVTPELLQLLNF